MQHFGMHGMGAHGGMHQPMQFAHGAGLPGMMQANGGMHAGMPAGGMHAGGVHANAGMPQMPLGVQHGMPQHAMPANAGMMQPMHHQQGPQPHMHQHPFLAAAPGRMPEPRAEATPGVVPMKEVAVPEKAKGEAKMWAESPLEGHKPGALPNVPLGVPAAHAPFPGAPHQHHLQHLQPQAMHPGMLPQHAALQQLGQGVPQQREPHLHGMMPPHAHGIPPGHLPPANQVQRPADPKHDPLVPPRDISKVDLKAETSELPAAAGAAVHGQLMPQAPQHAGMPLGMQGLMPHGLPAMHDARHAPHAAQHPLNGVLPQQVPLQGALPQMPKQARSLQEFMDKEQYNTMLPPVVPLVVYLPAGLSPIDPVNLEVVDRLIGCCGETASPLEVCDTTHAFVKVWFKKIGAVHVAMKVLNDAFSLPMPEGVADNKKGDYMLSVEFESPADETMFPKVMRILTEQGKMTLEKLRELEERASESAVGVWREWVGKRKSDAINTESVKSEKKVVFVTRGTDAPSLEPEEPEPVEPEVKREEEVPKAAPRARDWERENNQPNTEESPAPRSGEGNDARDRQ